LATTRARPGETLDLAGGIRRAAARLGLSAREAREIVALTEKFPRDDAALAAALGDVLVERSLEHGWPAAAIRRLLSDAAETGDTEVEALEAQVHTRAARNPSLLALSPSLALEIQVRILRALSPAEDVSLWSLAPNGELVCLAHAGETEPSRRARLLARAFLAGGPPPSGLLRAVPVQRWQRIEAALVFRVPRDLDEETVSAAVETAATLTPVLEREALLTRNASRERALVASGERLLTRVGFDLHDGPIQDVAALAADIRMLRQRVEEHPGPISQEILFGFMDDLHARIGAIDRGLRAVVHSLESPAVGRSPLDASLQREVQSFQLQSDIRVELTLTGAFDQLTDSQRIALLRILQESLSNARDHGGARSIDVSVEARPNETRLQIVDDGRGFDVPRTLVRAARRGRFGLLGMSERVRLLGGRFDVDSRPGGPTVVSVVLPAWRPVTESEAQDGYLVA
jgi:signal transduction histidine kinase